MIHFSTLYKQYKYVDQSIGIHIVVQQAAYSSTRRVRPGAWGGRVLVWFIYNDLAFLPVLYAVGEANGPAFHRGADGLVSNPETARQQQ